MLQADYLNVKTFSNIAFHTWVSIIIIFDEPTKLFVALYLAKFFYRCFLYL